MGDKKLLVDTILFQAQLLEDNSSRGGRPKIVARGEFARADHATENKRVYPKTLWEREISRLQKSLADRKVYGTADHPLDGRTQLKAVSHIVTGLHLDGNVIVGEAEILDTAEGRNLKAIFEANGAVGVSSRGFGTTRPNMKGEDVVQDDYRLMTFDFVADPANITSYPSIHSESKSRVESKKPAETPMVAEAVMDIDLERLRKEHPAVYENIMNDAEREYEKRGAEIWAKKISAAKQEATTDLRGEFAEKLQQAIADVRKEVAEEERAKLMADPTVAGAKKAMEGVKEVLRPFIIPSDVESVVGEKETQIEELQNRLAEQELRIAKVQEENNKLASIAKEAGYRYHLEKLIGGNPQSELIRKLVGDVKAYESVDEINNKVTAIADEIEKTMRRDQEHDTEVERLKAENEKLRMSSEKALEATKILALQSYVESRLANHPRAAEARALLEHVESREKVDEILSSLREKKKDPVSIEEARQRVRELVGSSGTREYIAENTNGHGNGVAGRNGNFNGLGCSVEQLRALAGINNNN